ncbi:N-acetylglucosamine 6-phosphate deacetylase [Dyella jiangningensis]|uniref:N-acetylglucosamine-6-phosphate deacetylase n=1 Tax=Dyella sp. AtDHG13 TaxID=1938897 RepID=UPI00088401B7|nr:N-acetylglucosamine-6-phosphate deacetylase [Dyella sp. AtDHG13]PXV52839.1 N-acetylglucosamine 6-phosphate deacetylase [Dyella sp. AtDHG13]SDK30589.1 N-acetylglucosamine 6-phosphate deacetylase [Dyella jiangningensis]
MTTPLTALINGRVLTDHGPQAGLAVLVRGQRIEAIARADDPRVSGAKAHDLQGRLLLPGFIDVQVNGGGGVLFNAEPTVEALATIGAAHRKYGTTGFLPTLITDTAEVMRKALDAVDAAIEQGVPGVLGIHLEGPFLATARKGIHDASLFRLPDAQDIAAITRNRRGVVMLTLAVEEVPLDTIRQLSEAGVLVVAGHTAATYAHTRAALDAGVCGFTHLYNAMTPLGSREPGVVGAALDDPHSWCGLIVDGHHVHPVALRVAIAAKAKGKSVLVTDAMPPVGSDNPEYVLNGQTIIARDGICQSDAGVLAGSALDMATGVRNLVDMVGLPLAEASRMASAYPAAWLGLDRTHGRLVAGQKADFAVLDDGLVVKETWISGVRYGV